MIITYTDVENLRKQGLTWREIGETYAVPLNLSIESVSNTLRHVYRRKGKTTLDKCTTLSSRRLEGSDGSTTSEKVFTEELTNASESDLLEFHGFKSEDWHIKETVSAIKNGKWTNRIKIIPRKFSDISEDKLKNAIKSALSELPDAHKYAVSENEDEHVTAVLPLYDIHYGRQYFVNGVEFDHENTREQLIDNTASFVGKMRNSNATELIIVIGQDFLNFDNPSGTTTKGTLQSNSLPWHELFSSGLALLHTVIEMCRGTIPIKIIYSEGNHDVVLSYCLAQALKEAYTDCSDISFNVGAESRKYDMVDRTLLGFSHFSEESKLSTVMQSEVPKMWGRSLHRYWITGHVHHLEMYDKDGVVIFRCPSPTFNDEWSDKKGYIGSMQKQIGFLFSDNGLEEMWLIGD